MEKKVEKLSVREKMFDPTFQRAFTESIIKENKVTTTLK